MSLNLSIGMFVKKPLPGKVKTRLGRDIGMKTAAIFYAECIALLYERLVVSGYDVDVFVNEADNIPFFRKCFEIVDDDTIKVQQGKNLGRKMFNALDFLSRKKGGLPVVIGSDSPTLPMDYLSRCRRKGRSTDVVIGPARDGGYYLISTNEPNVELFKGIEWSKPDVLEKTIDRITSLGLDVEFLPKWNDVDRLDDLIDRADRASQ